MADKRPVFTENFSANLAVIREFMGAEGALAFQRLLAHLLDDIVPSLCEFPQSGRGFLAHVHGSEKTRRLIKQLRGRLKQGDDLREVIMDDYLILYLVRGDHIVVLSIKHHRQLSFDLKKFWQEL